MTTSDGSTRKHSHYHKDVGHLLTMDVYRLCERFEINDPSGATQHAIKKLVCAGQRGSKGLLQDLQEAVDTINRRIEMIYEDRARDALLSGAFGPASSIIDPADVDIASAIDDDSERQQLVQQNGEMADEVYAAVDGWIYWGGGERPVKEGVLIDTRHRDGELWLGSVCGENGTRTHQMFWDNNGDRAEVIAYRLHTN